MCCERRGFRAQERRVKEEVKIYQSCCRCPQNSGHVVRKSQCCHCTQKQHNQIDVFVTTARRSKGKWARIPAFGSFFVPIHQGCLATTPRPKPSDQANGQGPLGQANYVFMRAPNCVSLGAGLEELSRSKRSCNRKTSVRRLVGAGD